MVERGWVLRPGFLHEGYGQSRRPAGTTFVQGYAAELLKVAAACHIGLGPAIPRSPHTEQVYKTEIKVSNDGSSVIIWMALTARRCDREGLERVAVKVTRSGDQILGLTPQHLLFARKWSSYLATWLGHDKTCFMEDAVRRGPTG